MGPAVARVARALGTPLMPWQQYVADVGGEVDERGGFVYSLVIVTVPSQSGKTTLMLAQSVQRCLMAARRKTWHTAQTGQAAREKFRELADAVTGSPLAELVAGKPRKAAGSEALDLPQRLGAAPAPADPRRAARRAGRPQRHRRGLGLRRGAGRRRDAGDPADARDPAGRADVGVVDPR
jgi:hypothetical protein